MVGFEEMKSSGREIRTFNLRSRLTIRLKMLNLADRLTLVYLCFSAVLIAVCRRNVSHWEVLLPVHFGLMAMIAYLAAARNRRTPLIETISHWYPTVLFLFFFEEIGLIVHAIFPGWFDQYLIRADLALFGVHPTVWIEQFSSYWLTEYMQLVYTSYYLLTIGFGAYLWLRGRRSEFSWFITATCAAYYLSYPIFVLFPVESPHHTLQHLQQVELAGGPVTDFINLIEKHGRVHGGAFPSAHVAGSMVVLFSAFKFERKLAWLLAPLILSICLATIYGRYHYVMDVFAGTLMAAIGCMLADRLEMKDREKITKQTK
ncbi:MAG: phosphatase PAP2 family protein [Acidobacteria bacterium]|nr:phosphatase PAP2 family protein [Acidobacteriota bacterium]